MEYIFSQIESALDNNLYFLALFVTLSIPDICSTIDSTEFKSNSKRYKEWITSYFYPQDNNKYGTSKNLKADDVWKFRCSMFHNGWTSNQSQYSKIYFFEPTCDNPLK